MTYFTVLRLTSDSRCGGNSTFPALVSQLLDQAKMKPMELVGVCTLMLLVGCQEGHMVSKKGVHYLSAEVLTWLN